MSGNACQADASAGASIGRPRETAAFPRRGLYAITPENSNAPAALALKVRQAIQGGAKLVQFRAKHSPDMRDAAQHILNECRLAGVPLLINDDVDLMQHIGADGVHLGRDDLPLSEARYRLGPAAIIGVSCYDSIERAMEAQSLGASYVAFGRFFPSQTKPDAPLARLETLIQAKRQLRIPVVAIGGITAGNGQILIDAGADLLAVIDGIFGDQDIEQAAASIQRLFGDAHRD